MPLRCKATCHPRWWLQEKEVLTSFDKDTADEMRALMSGLAQYLAVALQRHLATCPAAARLAPDGFHVYQDKVRALHREVRRNARLDQPLMSIVMQGRGTAQRRARGSLSMAPGQD